MYGFINHINNEKELLEQIKKQTKLGFWGYYLNKMFNNGMTYHKGENVNEKRALQIITPQQSLFASVRDNYEDVCFTLLRTVYGGKMPDNHLNLTSGLKDVVACMNLGNIYVTERDTDIPKDNKGFFDRVIKGKERQFDIYIPPHISNSQMEELKDTLTNRNLFKKWFRKDRINVLHYIDNDKMLYYNDKEALQYLDEELPNSDYISKDVPINPDERIIVDSYVKENKRENATFVPKVNTKTSATIREDNSVQENQSKTENNGHTTPAGTGTLR